MNQFAFWTDVPPILDNAHGNHGIARHIIHSCGQRISLVLTHRYRRRIDSHEISRTCFPTKVFFYLDCASLGVRRFFPKIAAWIDLILFAVHLPAFVIAIRRSGASRIFALLGADGFTLLHLLLLTFSGVPVDVYLVDDLVESAKKSNSPILAKQLLWLEPYSLKRCARVFTISPGFAEHLYRQHGIFASPLYPPLSVEPGSWNTFSRQPGKPMPITFIGGINHLYESALLEIYSIILDWNRSHASIPIELRIATYSDPMAFLKKVPNVSALSIHRDVKSKDLSEMLANSWAVFLPYSFSPEEHIMVYTSFSCKILEYLQSGRPMLVYGPEDASIPRHFRENNIPLCATNRKELEQNLATLASSESPDNPTLGQKYHKLWKQHHSPSSFFEQLLRPTNIFENSQKTCI